MIVATILFALMHGLAKWQVGVYPVGEVMFLRSLCSLIVCAAVLLPIAGIGIVATKRVGAHVARGLSQSVSQTCSVIAFSLMPLAGAIAINFSAPLWAALLSIIWLKEPAGPVRWSVLLTGFCGVVIVANPGADAIQIGALFALANAVMYGSVTVAVRGMTATESTGTLMIWQMFTVAAFHSLLLPLGFRWPTAADLTLFAASGVANVGAQYFWTMALRLGPAPAISPFYYLTLVWAVIIGYLGWDDIPTVPLLAGSTIVVLSGLFLLWHETRKVQNRERVIRPCDTMISLTTRPSTPRH
jgi:drug/metabolite transporter (DMT)-like permease